MINMSFINVDIKILRLAPYHTEHGEELAEWLYANQGKYRESFEPRIFIIFEDSWDSSVEFFKQNRNLIMNALLDVVNNPYGDTHYYLKNYGLNCWIAIISKNKWVNKNPRNYSHPNPSEIGLKEKDKAEFEFIISQELGNLTEKWKHNPIKEEHGKDGEIWLPYRPNKIQSIQQTLGIY